MGTLVSTLKLVGIGLLGYLLIALGQTLALEVVLGGQLAPDSPPTILALATLGTLASGLIGGYLSARLGGKRPWLHTSVVVALLSIDAVFVVVKNVGGNPVWFDLSGALTLMLATAAGGWLRSRTRATGKEVPVDSRGETMTEAL